MTYELRDHTADVAVEATAPTLSGLFESLAEGFTAASCESVPAVGDRFDIELGAESREALLFDYLDQLVYERDVRNVLPAEHECAVAETGDGTETWTVRASARGVPLDEVAAREIKAVTYSEMALEERDDGWYGYVVFDV
ncbi:archease [Halorubrum sp. DTA98]|uniref:archease n=1 Tax=Halorubrum sp. DTA98 TaxID=3402163 RepID=UPI003AACC81D